MSTTTSTPTLLNDPFLVNATTSGWQYLPSLTATANSGLAVSWSSDATGWDAHLKLYNSDISAFLGETMVNTTTEGSQAYSEIVQLTDGNLMVVWASGYNQSAPDQDGDEGAIVGRIFSSTGAAVSSEFVINTYSTGNQWFPDVAALADGGFVAVWESEGQDGDNSGVYGQRFAANGTATGDKFQINTSATNRQGITYAEPLVNGGFIASFANFGSVTSSFVRLYDDTGTPTGDPVFVGTSGKETVGLRVAESPEGGFFAVWQSEGGDADGRAVQAQFLNFDGSARTGVFQVNTTESLDQMTPALTLLQDGSWLVAWTSDTGNTNGRDILGQRIAASGLRIGEEFTINNVTANEQSDPQLDTLADGTVVVLWRSWDEDGAGWGVVGQALAIPELTETPVEGTDGADYWGGTSGADVLDALAGDDSLIGWGGADSLRGGAGADSLDGKNGNDYLFGGTEDDLLIGWGGRDRLRGNNGNDTMEGGAKNDFLQGGEGADVFRFSLDNGPWAKDYIKDFELGVDRVEVIGFTADDVQWKDLKSGLGVMAIIEGGGRIVFNGLDQSDLDSFADWDFMT